MADTKMVKKKTSTKIDSTTGDVVPEESRTVPASAQWDDELLTTRELMAMMKLSRTKIWELVQNNGLPAFKIGGDYRYRRSEVLEWMERYRTDRRTS